MLIDAFELEKICNGTLPNLSFSIVNLGSFSINNLTKLIGSTSFFYAAIADK